MCKIKAILFDMDGVLIDAKEWHYESLNKALSLFGMEISRYDHLVTFDGLPTKRKLEMLSLEKGLSRALHQFIYDMKQEYTMQMTYSQCKPRYQHKYAIAKLKGQGYKIAVCSNSIRHTVQVMMERAALLEYLEFFLSNEDVTRPKPHPDIYTCAINKLQLQPSEVLVVEDNENGFKAAESSGAHLMKVRGVDDVTHPNIMNCVRNIEAQNHA